MLLERVARGTALLMLLVLAIEAFRDRSEPVHAVVRSPDLPGALTRWSTSTAPAGVHVQAVGAFAPFARDWLSALPGAGTRVTWEGAGPAPIALAAEPVADPEGGTSAWIAAPAGIPVIVEDAVGRLDSIQFGIGGVRALVRASPKRLLARSGTSVARSEVSDSLVLGRLLLLGRVGWESKFVAAALEERGWKIDVRLQLSPRGDVWQGSAASVDTSVYSAVIVLDSVGTLEAGRILAYVRSGGGVVLAPSALRTVGLGTLGGGSPGALQPGREPFDTSAAEPRRGLELIPLTPRADAVVLERRGNMAAVAARRIERGRAVTSGYLDTWRWRMGGGAEAVRDHRDWWADLVSGVAHTGHVERPSEQFDDEAPLATLITRLGPSSSAPVQRTGAPPIPPAALFAVFAAALLLEWTSRRLRGAP